MKGGREEGGGEASTTEKAAGGGRGCHERKRERERERKKAVAQISVPGKCSAARNHQQPEQKVEELVKSGSSQWLYQ